MIKTFKFKLLAWLCALCTTLWAMLHCLYVSKNYVWSVLLGFLACFLLWRLYGLVSKTNKVLSDFLENIKYDDYAATYAVEREQDASFQDLFQSFNVITDKFRDIRSEKEAQFQYLQAIVSQMETGLICFNEAGKTILMNQFLQKLVHRSYFSNQESIGQTMPELLEAMQTIVPGERKLVKMMLGNEIVQLSLRKTALKLQSDTWFLFSIHNIHAELDEKEMQSWQKLIRILTHEIMNSVAPITSLAASTQQFLSVTPELDAEAIHDIRLAVQAIEKRSQGLMHFTETYRTLTRIPTPEFKTIDFDQFLGDLETLLQPEFDKAGVVFSKKVRKQALFIQADRSLLEQVFINLLKNALEAFPENQKEKRIELEIQEDRSPELLISIRDNGSGIEAAKLDQIFIPFFTTKKEGSGIGLSLCRQILHLHKASISVFSEHGTGTVFLIRI